MSDGLSRSLLINTLWSFLGRFGYLAVGLITNIVLVRLLSPEDFGQIGITMFFIVVASVLAESGLSGALVRKKDVTEIDYSTIFLFNLVVSITLMLLLITFAGSIANFYEAPKLKNILILSSFILLINSFKIIQSTRLVKELKFKIKALYDFIAVLIASILSIILAYNGAGVWSLVFLPLLTALILTLILWIFVGPLNSYKFSIKSFKQFYKFGINTTLASLLSTGFDNIYQLILGRFFSISQTGYFYQAKKLQEIPSGIFVMISSGTVYATLARLQDSPKEFNLIYKNIVKIFTIIIALVNLLIFYYSEAIVLILYGDKWISSAYYMQLLSIGSYFYVQEMFNRNIFKIFDRTEKILHLEVLKKLVQICTIVYGIWSMSIESLLYGFIITNIFGFISSYYLSEKLQNNLNLKDVFISIKIIITAIIIVLLFELIAQSLSLTVFKKLYLLPFMIFLYFTILYIFNVTNIYRDIISFRKFIS